MEQSSVLFTSSLAERLLQSTSPAGQAKVFWRNVQAGPVQCTLSLFFFYKMYSLLGILPSSISFSVKA
jgi:hypothetical protein